VDEKRAKGLASPFYLQGLMKKDRANNCLNRTSFSLSLSFLFIPNQPKMFVLFKFKGIQKKGSLI